MCDNTKLLVRALLLRAALLGFVPHPKLPACSGNKCTDDQLKLAVWGNDAAQQVCVKELSLMHEMRRWERKDSYPECTKLMRRLAEFEIPNAKVFCNEEKRAAHEVRRAAGKTGLLDNLQ